jgi:hypothetical protein
LQAVRPSTSQRTRPQGPKKTSPAWPVDTRKRHLAKGVEFRARGVQGVRGHDVGRTELAEPRADAIFEFSRAREVPARAARPPERRSQDTCGPWPSRSRSPNQRPIIPRRRYARSSRARRPVAARGGRFGARRSSTGPRRRGGKLEAVRERRRCAGPSPPMHRRCGETAQLVAPRPSAGAGGRASDLPL